MVPGPPEGSLLISSIPTQDQSPVWDQVTPRYQSNNAITSPLPFSITRGINANELMRESYLVFILEEYHCHRISKFFGPPISMRDFLVTRMKRSRVMELMYLGAKIFETFGRNPEKVAIQSCSQWITRYANYVTKPEEPPNPYPSVQEVEDKLNVLLELGTAQFIVLGTAAGYSSLRLALPSLLRVVSDYPNLLVEKGRHGLLSLSLPAVLSSNWLETRRFVFQDILGVRSSSVFRR
ncbi:hypothetical protein RSAG8_06701, partial [Rhizoctonia solani AG-8 WAC10335]